MTYKRNKNLDNNPPSHFWLLEIFIKALIVHGCRSKASKIVYSSFQLLKKNGVINPYLALFEITELLILPIKACRFTSRGRTTYLVKRISWIQQYKNVAIWFRNVLYRDVTKSQMSAPEKLKREIELFYSSPKKSQLCQQKELELELISLCKPMVIPKRLARKTKRNRKVRR